MTFLEKYNILQDKNYLKEMISKSVYDTMQLEGQGLPMDKINRMVEEALVNFVPTPKKG
jgi:hypothetical protein